MPTVNSVDVIDNQGSALSELISVTGTVDGEIMEVLGYYSPGDGGGGTFYWDSSGDTDNYGTVIVPGGTPGTSSGPCWRRRYDGVVNAKWFGAVYNSYGGTNVTIRVQSAINVAASGSLSDGMLYFPKGIYCCSITLNNVSIYGDGLATIIECDQGESQVIIINQPKVTITNLVIRGYDQNNLTQDGVVFDNKDANYVVFENVHFTYLNRAVYKPYGNIANCFYSCTWWVNEFGYYAQNNPSPPTPMDMMHCGCDQFIGGHMQGSNKAAIYVRVDELGGYGQLIIDGTKIETNIGFGILIKIVNGHRMIQNPVSIRNVWMEANGGSGSPWVNSGPITIDGNTYPTTTDYYFEGVRSVTIADSNISGIILVDSSVALNNCYTSPSFWYYIVDVDSTSQLIANELSYNDTPSERIYCNSIAYDGSRDIALRNTFTSVWGPVRNNVVKNIGNIQYGYFLDSLTPYSWPPTEVTVVQGGVLKDTCQEITVPSGTHVFLLNFTPVPGKYYFWSINAYLVSGQLFGRLFTPSVTSPNPIEKFGEIITKPGQWVCSYGLKKYMIDPVIGNPEPVELWLQPVGGGPVTVRLCDFQMIEFDNYYDAQSYANSRSFSVLDNNQDQAVAYGRLMEYTGTIPPPVYTLEDSFNIDTFIQISTGIFTINLSNPKLSGNVIPAVTAIIRSSPGPIHCNVTSLSTSSFTVEIYDDNHNPVDNPFTFIVY